MKIQDIFNLPKNRGGAKLFQRIMNRYGIPKEDSKELKNNIDNSSSGGGENTGQIEYLYICFSMTATNPTRDIMLTYLGNAQIVEYKGKLLIAPTVKNITLASPNTMAGNTPPQYAKIVKGIVTNNGVTCDCTSFDKFIQNEGVDSSQFYEITEEEYNNYK